ncbi:hypothetical protein [Rhizobium sp. LjRoot254]|uniref:hypothetical protein n=1 Tax=Rhizobium sp. LjRoot254 TaxID=3342297 RepID=UPI003ECD58CD
MNTEGQPVVVRRRFRWQYALIIIAAAILFFWEPIDNWLNFETQTVEVKSVQTLCTAFDNGSPVPREVGPCDDIRAEYGSDATVEIREQTFVAFDYTSPADGKVHSTKIVRDKDDAGQPIHAGSRITVRLSGKQADFVK